MNRVISEEEHLTTAEIAGAGEAQEPRPEEPRVQESENQADANAGPLLPADFTQELRTRWDRIQTGFVDEPRAAVKQADELVASAMKRLAESFADARNGLERQWDRGGDVSTEDLRIALRRYRAFFQRLLAV